MKKLAIVGATGLVGQTVLKVIKEQGLLDKFQLYLIVSDRSAGKIMVFNSNHYYLFPLGEDIFKFDLDYAIFSAGDEVSKKWVPIFAEHGITVIDNSAAFRKDDNVPLFVPEINFEKIKTSDKIIANPNCSTIQLVVVLGKMSKLSAIKKVVVSSYQSVSGAGRDALLDLKNGTNNYFERGICNNIIAQIGNIDEQGNCGEENKIVFETQKILEKNFEIYATTVRVPIEYCHGESVYIEFEKDVCLGDIKQALKCEYIEQSDELIFPCDLFESDKTYVFRLRKVSKRKIMFFILANNLRRGAAYNAVMILKKILQKKK